MHELTVAINIVENIEEEAKKNKLSSINELTIEIGKLSGVVLEALEFAMQEAVKSSVLENARIVYQQKNALAKCNACGNEFEVDDFFSVCTKCNNPYSDIITGKELRIISIKASDNL
jgi:hydrogenase nickel incorporation protein HypA/HybF